MKEHLPDSITEPKKHEAQGILAKMTDIDLGSYHIFEMRVEPVAEKSPRGTIKHEMQITIRLRSKL